MDEVLVDASADLASAQAGFDDAFEAKTEAPKVEAPVVAAAPEVAAPVVEVAQPELTPAEIRAAVEKTRTFDEQLEKRAQLIFSKVGELHRNHLAEVQKALKAGGSSARRINADALKKMVADINGELPGFGEIFERGLPTVLTEEIVAGAEQAQATAQAQGKPFDQEAYYAEKVAPALKELEARAAQQQARLMAEARQYARLDAKHEDWESAINSPEFVTWAYRNGPTPEERQQQWQLEQSNPAAAATAFSTLMQKYPQWWAASGHLINSDKAVDAIKLLDEFKASKKPAASPNKARLEAAIPVKGTPGGARPQTESEREAMEREFNAQFD